MIDRSTPQILMCRPEFYGIQYEINPWMSRLRQSDRPTAERQWSDLRHALEAAGATISLLPPVEGLPDMVFTANAALIYSDRAVMAHFRHPERQGEVAYDEAWLREEHFRIEHVPDDLHFEGAGDALFCGDTLFAGYRIRSAARGHQQIGEMLGCRVIPLDMDDTYYYHLNTCF
jgi:N-dimethylarginine dimethylaminohydrolase